MLVAPATSNIIAKAAHGLCDDLVSLMICAAACPVVFAPAMNNRMWANPIAQENVTKLTNLGYRFIGPDDGWLACRNVGPGRSTLWSFSIAKYGTQTGWDPYNPDAGNGIGIIFICREVGSNGFW